LSAFVQVAAEFSGGTHPEGVWLDNGLFGNQGAGGDDGAGSDDGSVKDDEPMPIRQRASTVQPWRMHVVADGDVVADVDAVLFFHAVEDGVVLNVGIMADADLVDVAAENGVHPDAGVFAENDIADDLGGVVDVGGVGELRGDAVG
jgi:hypothetical protein